MEDLLTSRLRRAVTTVLRGDEYLVDEARPELTALLRAALWFVTVARRGSTYGTDLQNLALSAAPLSRATKLAHLCLSVALPWAWSRSCREMASRGWSTDVGDQRGSWRWWVWRACRSAETCVKVAAVLNFLWFLRSGRHPTLVHRVLGIVPREANSGIQRTVLFGLMSRQLFWEGLTDLAVLSLPILTASRARRIFSRAISLVSFGRLSNKKPTNARPSSSDAAGSAQSMECGICGADPAETPYTLGCCRHVHCYSCLWNARQSDPQFSCPTCNLSPPEDDPHPLCRFSSAD